MALPHFSSLNELLPLVKADWKIKVQISRKWKDHVRENCGQPGLNVIVVDEHKERMHIWIKPTLLRIFENFLEDGEMYEIKDFIVTPYRQKYKCFASEKHIVFTQHTSVQQLNLPAFVPRGEFFDFYYFGNINAHLYQQMHCIDVIGVLKERGNLRSVFVRDDPSITVLDLVITDCIYDVNVSLCDELALSTNAALNLAVFEPLHPVIIIISSCRMVDDTYSGIIKLAGSGSTKIYVNHNIPRAQFLRDRFNGIED